MYNVLKKHQDQRTRKEMSTIGKLIGNIPFFKEREMGEQALIDVCWHMTVLAMPANKTVVEFGSVGDNFYFILHGGVAINIPNPEKLSRFKAIKKEISDLEDELESV